MDSTTPPTSAAATISSTPTPTSTTPGPPPTPTTTSLHTDVSLGPAFTHRDGSDARWAVVWAPVGPCKTRTPKRTSFRNTPIGRPPWAPTVHGQLGALGREAAHIGRPIGVRGPSGVM
ncbi:hypothetical protein PSTG_18156 [Puccinia striiformis f. sp. tritici PST-78]|uniref:Uncharacterized protein n=1 Tax=Puccinia striiformis f. sp. tritici PST-78 TaxID=1165861 RepID=A0A0L0UN36_9BASI|nr:hypothetical protein PSTG_18156 [Puccinia striiformis f. sp. tritici PST-78]